MPRIVLAAALFAGHALAASPELKIDGLIDEAAWQRAQVFRDFVVVEPYTLAAPSHPTEALLLSTPEGIAIAFRCSQPAGVPRIRERTPRDADMPGDRVNVFIDFNGDGETAYDFTIALSGSVQDATVTNENFYSPDWDGDWKHRVHETEDGWSAEFLLPWTVAAMKGSGAPRRTVAVMFDRVLGHTRERSGFPAATFMRPRFVSEFHKIEIDQYQASVFHIFPYLTGSYDFRGDARDGKAGADLYWKPSGDFQLTAALNPDFGQVEADELVVNFDAIETFFSDRRPFFTENQGLFDLRTPDSGLLIYTRRIGGPRDDDPGRAAEIDAALKLNGSIAGYDYGVLAAQEAEHADELGSRFLAQRLLRAQGSLSLGYLGTYAERPFLEREAQVHAFDATWRIDERWALSGQVLASDIDRPGRDKHGFGAWSRVDYTPDANWRQELELTHFDAGLDFNDMGFQRRASLNELEWTIQRQRPVDDETSALRTRSWSFELQARSNDAGERLPLVFIGNYRWGFRDGSELSLDPYVESAGYNDLISRGNGLVHLPQRASMYLEYDTRRFASTQYEVGGGYREEGLGGGALELWGGMQWFARENLTLQASFGWTDSRDWLIWDSGTLLGRYQREQLSSDFNLDWFPAPGHEFRVKLQWLGLSAFDARAVRIGAGGNLHPVDEEPGDFVVDNLGLQLRYRWAFAAQSDLYVVYGRGGIVERLGRERDFVELLDEALQLRDADQLLVKLRRRF